MACRDARGRPSVRVLTGEGRSTLAHLADTFDVLYQDKSRNVLAPQWSPRGDKIIFSNGTAKFQQRMVVVDTSRIQSLLVTPL